jgi:hypothetical protein
MSDLQEDYGFNCPYCASWITVLIDLTGGEEQSFTTDCEICCRPISIYAEVNEDGVMSFDAVKESN